MAAEVDTSGGGKKKGKKKKKRTSGRIDLTAMVDLAFLLLTFFILTTTLSTPQTMPVVVPPKIKDEKQDEIKREKVAESKMLVLLLADNDRIYYYQPSEKPELKATNFSKNGIRKVLLEKEAFVQENFRDNAIYLIKIDDSAKYKNVVDILDEMNITNMKKYALVDITKEEQELIKKYKEQFST